MGKIFWLLLRHGENAGIVLMVFGAGLIMINIAFGCVIITLGLFVIFLEFACRFYRQLKKQ